MKGRGVGGMVGRESLRSGSPVLLRGVLGCLLIAIGGMKVIPSGAASTHMSETLFDGELLLAVGWCEVAAGVLIFTPWWHRAAAAVFGAFAVMGVVYALARIGSESSVPCGCLGPVSLPVLGHVSLIAGILLLARAVVFAGTEHRGRRSAAVLHEGDSSVNTSGHGTTRD